MDWDLAIKRNSEALKEIIAGLFAMLELAGGITVSRIPQSLHSAVRRVLWPAESAMRRLIVIAARGLVVKLSPARPGLRPKPVGKIGKGGGSKRPSFQLFDPRKNFSCVRPQKVHAQSATHPFLRRRFPGGRPVAVTPARSRSPSAALRWPRQCRAPHPEARGSQAGT